MKDFNDVHPPEKAFDLILVDTMNLCARNFHGIKLCYNGKSTSILYGLIQFVIKCSREFPGARIVFLLEGCNSKRKELYPDYKANRVKLEDGFFDSLNEAKEVIKYLGFDQIFHKGLEADDLCAYFTSISEKDDKILLVSTDRDWYTFLQPDHISILKENTVFSYMDIRNKLGFIPEKLGMYKILRGDRSDNISGIKRLPNDLILELISKYDNYKQFKDFDFTVKKTWVKWGNEILDNWKNIIEKNAELILFQKSWVNTASININPGKRDKEFILKVMNQNGFIDDIPELKKYGYI